MSLWGLDLHSPKSLLLEDQIQDALREESVNNSTQGHQQLLKVYRKAVGVSAAAVKLATQATETDTPLPTAAVKLSTQATEADTPPPITIPDNIVEWLARLILLYGVPFEYLVPDAAMLPIESIRFFYIDQNWTNRLIDGAVNIALGSTQDYVQVLTTFEETVQAAALEQHNVRAKLRAKPTVDKAAVGGTLTGVLLRSAVVSGWPGLEVTAYSDEEGTNVLPLLRMDRVSNNVLICLFNGVPQRIDFTEPPEGLNFGVINAPHYEVALRGLGIGGHTAGEQILDNGNAVTSPITFRTGTLSSGVLDINQIKNDLIENLQAQGALDKPPVFTASQFAVQLVKGAGRQQFKTVEKSCKGNNILDNA
ncbi:MAG: hypothetical protein F6J94_05695 [Moorea sp. SIO1F2]|uniref:hypothetical protein n=1 Tax=Moorena sp. SIO1F2 TaxID=2607819 RepID=UPI0013B95F78|nr:hypothetical protein [Moorena sp. SIO1F2]NET81462.1 hypothetical protein [Moorena sp. SIO1F2]